MDKNTDTKTRRHHRYTCSDCGKADGQPMQETFDRTGLWRMAHMRGFGCKKES